MPWSNENMQEHESFGDLTSESLYESILNSHVLVKPALELHEWMKVEKRESFLNSYACPGQTRTRFARELITVDERGFV